MPITIIRWTICSLLLTFALSSASVFACSPQEKRLAAYAPEALISIVADMKVKAADAAQTTPLSQQLHTSDQQKDDEHLNCKCCDNCHCAVCLGCFGGCSSMPLAILSMVAVSYSKSNEQFVAQKFHYSSPPPSPPFHPPKSA